MKWLIFLMPWSLVAFGRTEIPLHGSAWPPPFQKFEVKLQTNIAALAALPGEKEILALLEDRTLWVIDGATGAISRNSSKALPPGIQNWLRISTALDRAIVAGHNAIHIVDLQTLEVANAIPVPDGVTAIDLSADGKRIAAITRSRELVFLNLEANRQGATCDVSAWGRSFRGITWLPEGNQCLVRTWKGDAHVFTFDKQTPVCSLHPGPTFATADGTWLVSVDQNGASFFSAGAVTNAIASGGGSLRSTCRLNIPNGVYPTLLRDIPLAQWRLPGIQRFDPMTATLLPLFHPSPAPIVEWLAFADGRLFFSTRGRHLCCWDTWAAAIGNQSVMTRSEADFDAVVRQRGGAHLNVGLPFAWGERDCFAVFRMADYDNLREAQLELIDAGRTAAVLRTVDLGFVKDVEVHPSWDGRFLAVTTDSPGKSLTVSPEKLRADPALFRTAWTVRPSVQVLQAESDDIITHEIWKDRNASLVRFDPENRHLITFGDAPDSSRAFVLFDIAARKVIAEGALNPGENFDSRPPANDAQLLSRDRLVICCNGAVSSYRLTAGNWIPDRTRTAIDPEQCGLLPVPGSQLLLYSQRGLGRLLANETLDDRGWICPRLSSRALLLKYTVCRTEPETIQYRTTETLESFHIPEDVVPPELVIPTPGTIAYQLALGPDESYLIAAVHKKFWLVDYASGHVIDSVEMDPQRDIIKNLLSLGWKRFAARDLAGAWETWDLSEKTHRRKMWTGINADLQPQLSDDGNVSFVRPKMQEGRFHVEGGRADNPMPITITDRGRPEVPGEVIDFDSERGVQHWVVIPDQDLMAYFWGRGLWLVDLHSRQTVWMWPMADCFALVYSKSHNELLTSHYNLIRRWRVPTPQERVRRWGE